MKRVFLVFVFFVLSCSSTQQPAGSIAGVITADGYPLPGVTVTLSSTTRPSLTAISDASGRYTFRGVPQGQYTITTTLEGFNPQSFRVAVTSANIALNTSMRVSSVSESITVTASAPIPITMHTASGSLVSDDEVPIRASAKEHGFVETRKERVATFAIDVDRASYANVRRHLIEGEAPPPEAIRIEEMLNYFTYAYPQPNDGVPFSVTTEVAGCPWNSANRLVRIGIQGRNLEQWRMAPNNLVFLLDVSGSMSPPDQLPLIQQSFQVLVNELRAEDRVAIVVYAGAAGLVLPSTSGADKATILAAIDELQAGGSTAGGEGIELAYKIAQENFLPNGNNRVILATDGDFNVGPSSMEELEELIVKKRESDIFLSVIGVGDMEQDPEMELLGDKGNGNYAYLDSIAEAEKVFRHELTGTLVTIAKDVKVQLDLDPKAVKSYRQIGYENRALATKDFEDDTKDAGELGAGHSVTALFEIVPASSSPARLATLRLRYKEPTGKTSKPLLADVVDEGKSAYEASPDLQFAAAVAEMGMLLRDSPHKGNATWDDVFQLARVSQGVDLDGTRTEFVKLAEMAKELK
ncbi:MAG: von Willebrand factor type A domain-containing protein [Thermoanaerobaculia bacterium]